MIAAALFYCCHVIYHITANNNTTIVIGTLQYLSIPLPLSSTLVTRYIIPTTTPSQWSSIPPPWLLQLSSTSVASCIISLTTPPQWSSVPSLSLLQLSSTSAWPYIILPTTTPSGWIIRTSSIVAVAATGDGSNFVRISYWVFVILAPGHQGSHLKCLSFSGAYLFCEFPVGVLLRLSARVFVSGAGFWTGWTCLLCEVGIKFNHCVILAHIEDIWLYLSIYQVINILGYAFCNFLSWVWYFLT